MIKLTRCNCTWPWQPDIVVAESQRPYNFYVDTLVEMFSDKDRKMIGYDKVLSGNPNLYLGAILVKYKGFWLLPVDTVPGNLNIVKECCLTCGTCLGWSVNREELKVKIMKELERLYAKAKRKEKAERLCDIS